MGIVKHGTGEVIPEPEEQGEFAKLAGKTWNDEDSAELAEENKE